MLKFVLLAVVIVGVLWFLRTRPGGGEGGGAATRSRARPTGPVAMLACAHCGVHLPEGDAVFDADRRAYCGEAHRLAGPR